MGESSALRNSRLGVVFGFQVHVMEHWVVFYDVAFYGLGAIQSTEVLSGLVK